MIRRAGILQLIWRTWE